MRVLLAGQKRFGRAVLEMLKAKGHEVVAVSCPDDERDSLRVGAANHRAAILPARLTAALVPDALDLIVAAHCHAFLSAATRRKAELGALGFHPSLLPRHRGRSAVEWAIRMREPITGGSAYWMTDVVDGGPIAAQDWCHVPPGITARDLWRETLLPMGVRLIATVLDSLDRGVMPSEPQDPALATWEPAIGAAPPLWRPDVPMLGQSRFRVSREAARPSGLHAFSASA